jgi:leucyl aminopeptidase
MIPTSTDVSIAVSGKAPSGAAMVLFLGEGEEAAVRSRQRFGGEVAAAAERLVAAGAAKGKSGEIVFDLIGAGKSMRRVYLAGTGKAGKISTESLRKTSGSLVRALRKHHIPKAAILLPAYENLKAGDVAEAIVSGLLLAAFRYREYKGTATKDREARDESGPSRIEITIVAEGAGVKQAVDRAVLICEAQNFARTIASRPGNDINPPTLAKEAQAMAKDAGLRFSVLDEKQMRRLGMGGILAVGDGSIYAPPRMIVLEHKPARTAGGETLLVVGKAITFDTGGISIKPADKMGKMIFDKCGGMAVLGLMCAIAKLKLPVHVVGILASAENAISSRAYRPGDILRMYNGVTVDVTNTDAEGRLVLADALAWGIEKYKPSAVVDLATLTGGVIVALGKTMAGIMSSSDELVRELTEAGETAGEKMWRLPLGDEQRDFIKAESADIVNSAGREGHPLQGGAFLSYFVPPGDKVPWAHLDIAGVADTEKELPYYAVGATGWGVRTLLNWVMKRGVGK